MQKSWLYEFLFCKVFGAIVYHVDCASITQRKSKWMHCIQRIVTPRREGVPSTQSELLPRSRVQTPETRLEFNRIAQNAVLCFNF